MERILFYCSSCKSFYSKETKNPNEEVTCENCKSLLKCSNITKQEWDLKSKHEKDIIKKEYAKLYENESSYLDSTILQELQFIRKDVHVMATIISFLFALGVINVIFLLIVLL